MIKLERTMTMCIARTCAAALLALVLASGCEHLPSMPRSDDGDWLPAPSGTGLVADAASPVPDVPKPIGFVVVASKSRSSIAADGRRLVEHVYQGQAGLGESVNFYRENLRQHQWKPVSEQTAGAASVLRFTKGPENLEVRITRPAEVATVAVHISRDSFVPQPRSAPPPGPAPLPEKP